MRPSENEEEYFARLDFEKRKKLAAEHARGMAQEERDSLKKAHWMRCPKCGSELVTISIRDVHVDTCSSCNGMWLDAGELDLLVKSDDSGLLKSIRGIFS